MALFEIVYIYNYIQSVAMHIDFYWAPHRWDLNIEDDG